MTTKTTPTIDHAVGIIAAYVANNPVAAKDLPDLIRSVRATLDEHVTQPLGGTLVPEVEKATPAQIRKSITPDALVSFIDGGSYKTLRRHLATNGYDEHSYKRAFGLPSDYPMVSPNYSAQRSDLAKSLGLGQRRSPASAAAA